MSRFPALLGRKSGEVEIETHRLVFHPDDVALTPFEIPFGSIEITLAGQNTAHYLIKHRLDSSRVINVQDKEAIKRLAARGVEAAVRILPASKKKAAFKIAGWSSPVLIALVLVLMFPLILSFVPVEALRGSLSQAQEKRLGGLILKLNGGTLDAPSEAVALQSLDALAAVLKAGTPELQKYDFELHVSSRADANAFATLGSIIVINKGLLENAKSVDEIAGVLAHEMAHIERGHTIRSISSSVGLLMGLTVIGSMVGYDAAAFIARGANLVSLSYSREDETEADTRAFDFLRNAEISHDGLTAYFKRQAEESVGSSANVEKVLSIVSTHPATAKRIENLERLAETSPIEPLVQLTLQLSDFQAPKVN